MRDDNGGPAFPVAPFTQPNGEFDWGAPGMTLRDYFAAKASEEDIQGQIQKIRDARHYLPSQNMRQIARFMHADAMLAARTAGRDKRVG